MKISEALKVHYSCVYCLTFPNGKKYIGQTGDLGRRMRQYMQKGEEASGSMVCDAILEYGLDLVDVCVLAEVKTGDRGDLLLALSVLEIKYIRDVGTLAPNGYNVSVGGEILGLSAESIMTFGGSMYSGSPRAVLCYDLDGNLVCEYDSIEKCAYSLGVDSDDISEFLRRGRNVFRGEYMLRYKRYGEVPQKIMPYKPKEVVKRRTVYEDKVVVRERRIAKAFNPILKYDINGRYCGMYDTLADAAASVGLGSVQKGKITRGYIFLEYDGGEIREDIGSIERTRRRLPKYSDFLSLSAEERIRDADVNKGWSSLINDFPIGQYSKEGVLVSRYSSIKDASIKTGIPYANIWACVFGRVRKCRGYIWLRCDDDGNPMETKREDSSNS